MKRNSIWILAAALLALLVMGCDDNEPTDQVDGITLSPTECRIAPGEKVSIWMYTWPDTVDYHEITWSSSNKAVATLDENDWVVAVSEGKATITAETHGKSATCEVTVCAHSWSDLKCTKCGIGMYLVGGTISDEGVLTKYTGSAAEVVIPEGVTGIGYSAFYGDYGNSWLTSVTIPNTVTYIGNSAFRSCTKLKSVDIPDSVTSIGDSAFYYCLSLASVTIGDSVKSIGECAFSKCDKLKSVDIPDSVTSIGDSAFEYCTNLTSVTIGKGVTSIVKRTFIGCTNLTSVTIGESVTSIGSGAFYECSNLKTVNYDGTQQEWEKINRYKLFDKYYDDLSGKTITGKDGTTWTAEEHLIHKQQRRPCTGAALLLAIAEQKFSLPLGLASAPFRFRKGLLSYLQNIDSVLS